MQIIIPTIVPKIVKRGFLEKILSSNIPKIKNPKKEITIKKPNCQAIEKA